MTQEPSVSSFENVETAFVKEAIGNASAIYIEEISRQIIGTTNPELARDMVGNAIAFPSRLAPYLLGSESAISKVWESLRQSSPVFEAVMRTTVKLRALYSKPDWSVIVERQVAGIYFPKLQGTVADTSVTEHFAAGTSESSLTQLLTGNAWLVTLLLLNYTTVTKNPPQLEFLLREAKPPASKPQ